MITWKYLDAEVYPSFNEFQNVILSVSWICEFIDNGNVVFMEGKTGLEVENLDPNNYISFDTISYETIDTWVKEKLGLDNVTEIENSLKNRLSEILNPKIEKVLFNFQNETIVTEPVIVDTSNDNPQYSERELIAMENSIGIGTT
jgi:hypothetical protein